MIHIHPRAWHSILKMVLLIVSLTLCNAPHFQKTWLVFLHINTVTHKRVNHCCQSAAPPCYWPFNIYICHMMCLGKKNAQHGIGALETCPPLIKRFSFLLGSNNSYSLPKSPLPVISVSLGYCLAHSCLVTSTRSSHHMVFPLSFKCTVRQKSLCFIFCPRCKRTVRMVATVWLPLLSLLVAPLPLSLSLCEPSAINCQCTQLCCALQ